MGSAAGICQGASCQSNNYQFQEENPDESFHLGVVEKVQSVANQILALIIQAAMTHSFYIQSSLGGMLFANGVINLAKPKTSGVYAMGNIATGCLLSLLAYNQKPENPALLTQVFLAGALVIAFKTIKNLENERTETSIRRNSSIYLNECLDTSIENNELLNVEQQTLDKNLKRPFSSVLLNTFEGLSE